MNTGGGGFYAENGMGTPGNQSASKTANRQQFLCPVTIRQILEAPEDGLKVGSLQVTMVSLLGIVVDVDVTSTNVKFTLSDDTGVIECQEWIETDESGDTRNVPNIMENAYYKVFGVIKSMQGHKRIMVFKVAPLEDLNDYSVFMGEVLNCNQYAQKMVEGTDVSVGSYFSNCFCLMIAVIKFFFFLQAPMPYKSENTNNFNNTNNVNNIASHNNDLFTPTQRAVLEAIKACQNPQIGWDKKDPTLRSKFPAKQIE